MTQSPTTPRRPRFPLLRVGEGLAIPADLADRAPPEVAMRAERTAAV
jgi:hypothetical protein